MNVSGAGILKSSGDDSDTRKFVSYLLSEKGQKYFADKTFEYPLISAVPPAAGLPTIADLDPPKVDLDDLDSLETTVRLISDSGLTS